MKYFLIFLFPCFLNAQILSPTKERLESFQKTHSTQADNILNGLVFKNIGPSVMSGRVTDIDVNPVNPTEFYVAYASGGLWITQDNGISFSPIFDHEATLTIGDIMVEWQSTPRTLWIATGENNSSRSSYAGAGIYKSTDDGKTWKNMGLTESHHNSRIIKLKNRILIASLGYLYSKGGERGVFVSDNGGEMWKNTLFINDSTGVVDICVAYEKGNTVLYASSWQRDRKAWNFEESGSSSGIWRSEDSGDTWKLVSTPESGFPQGNGTGRIGLAASDNLLYAVIDNQTRRAPKEKDKDKKQLSKEKLKTISKEDFLKIDKKELKGFLKDNRFPEKYKAEDILTKVKNDKLKPNSLVEYLEDANSLLFETDVTGAELYASADGGKTWKKTHEGFLDDLYFTYGYYFGQIRIAKDAGKEYIWLLGMPLLRSDDGGKTFKAADADNVHADHHALWSNGRHVINGNDGGINITYNNGEHWLKCNQPAVGQCYAIAVDHAEPYNVYAGFQDNGVWTGPSYYKASPEWHQSGAYPYKSIMDGDGMQIQIDLRDNETVYTGYQFGNYYRVNKNTGASKYIQPKHELGERPLRFNWQTPIWLSVHNPDILYLGANRLYRSMDKGDNWTAISDDLTRGGRKGDVPFGTLTTIHESPKKFGLLYVGTDDGRVWCSPDGGFQWNELKVSSETEHLWVTRVQASAHEEGRVYATFSGLRNDHFKPYIFVSEDFGKTWKNIGGTLPDEPVNVIREDLENPNILYVGTDNGLYISFDRGGYFIPATGGLPRVAVHDIAIHAKSKDLLIGTHGRSIYKASIAELSKLNGDLLSKKLYVFDLKETKFSSGWGNSWSRWREPDTVRVEIPVFVANGGKATINVLSPAGKTLSVFEKELTKGLNYVVYNLTIGEKNAQELEKELNKEIKNDADLIHIDKAKNDKFYLPAAEYKIEVKLEGEKETKTLKVF